jgi:soluble lytic murein transglycosylase-like protein
MAKDGARYERWVEFLADDHSRRAEDAVAWTVVSNLLNDAHGRSAVVGDFDRFGVAMAEAGGRRVFVITLAQTAPPEIQAAEPPAPTPGGIVGIITAAANRHGVDPDFMIKIARCESSLNPRAYNPAGPYIGLFQFLPATFYAYGGKDIYSPADQSETTARMLARGLWRHWECAYKVKGLL